MKRSNRLVMLVGVFLAVIAFVGVIVLSSGGNRGGQVDPNASPTTKTVVVAKEDIALGTVIRAEQVETKTVEIAGAEADAYSDISQVIDQTARQAVSTGAQITRRTTSGQVTGQVIDLDVPAGMRAMSVRVDQVTGVGTLIKPGDYVDMLVRLEIQPTVPNEDGTGFEPVEGIDTTSSKLLLQGLQVIAVLLPPPPAPAEGAEGGATGGSTGGGTSLSDSQEIVILSLTPAQAEVAKFVEDPNLERFDVSLVLRSPGDFLDENGDPVLPESPCITAPLPSPPVTESPAPSPTVAPYRGCETTDGIILSSLIEQYGVLVPGTTEFGSVSGPPTLPTAEPTASPSPAP